MKIYLKLSYVIFIIVAISYALIVCIKPSFADGGYSGLISSNKTNKEDTQTPSRSGYKGLISGKTNSYNKKIYNNTQKSSTNSKNIFKSKSQKIREERAKNIMLQKQARENLQRLSGKGIKTMEQIKREALMREKKYKEEYIKNKRNRGKSKNKKKFFTDNKPPQTGDMNYPESRKEYAFFDSLEDIDLEVMKKNYSRVTVEDAVLDNLTLPPIMIRSLQYHAKKEREQGGESTTEMTGRLEIEKYFDILKKASNAPKKKRKEIYEKVADNLEAMEIRYQFERDLPEHILVKIGFPKEYLKKRERELDSVLSMISSARKELRRYKSKYR